MEALIVAVHHKRFAPGEIFAAVQRLRNQEQMRVKMVFDAESGQYPLVAKVKLEVLGEPAIVLYLPRHAADGSLPSEFAGSQYLTQTNVSFSTAKQLIKLLEELLGQSH